VRALGVTNLDVLGFVPLGCVFRNTNFYHKVLFQTISPVAIIALLWCYPILCALCGKSREVATRTVKRFALLLLVVCLPSISTSLIQVLVCDSFEDGSFLRAQLTLSCSDSEWRTQWVAIALVGIVAYPIGGAFCFPAD